MVYRILGSVGARVRSARLGAGITLAELAVNTGLSEATLSRLERGLLDSARLAHIELISESLGVSPKSLLCDEYPRRARTETSEAPTVRVRPIIKRKCGGR